MALALRSGAFADGGVIPRRHGYKHGNTSPPLEISGIPDGTRSLALIMDDPDAVKPAGKVWVHWVVWNIRPGGTFPEGSVPPGCSEGTTDFGQRGYGGPAPPDGEHTYVFKLYALSDAVDAPAGAKKGEIEGLIGGITIEEAVLRGRYSP